jgi:hypothetical protein
VSSAAAIIDSALEMIGAYAPGEPRSSADTTRALDQLNKMLDTWSNESLMAFTILEQSFALQAGKTAYTIGTSGGADVALTRPLRVIEGPGAAYLQDAGANNYAVRVVPRDMWNQIGNRGATTVSNVPDTMFYDPQFPLGVVNVWPAPTSTYRLYFDSYQQLGNLSNLTSNIVLPPGYEAAIQANLAVWLGPFFKSAAVPDDVKALARETKKIVKRTNRRTNLAQFDPMTSSRGTYDIYTDSQR